MTQSRSAFLFSRKPRWSVVVFLLNWFPIQSTIAQTIYTSDSSSVSFYSHTPIEDIEAVNAAATSMIEMSMRNIQFQVPTSAFQFENKMMQKHFNDGYLEPRKFPYATFRGKLSDSLDLSIDTIYRVEAIGMLNVHGIDRVGTFKGDFVCRDSIAALRVEFKIILEDHGVKVPGAIFDNVAKEVDVKMYFRYRPYRKTG